MPASSKKQQRLFGMIHAFQTGKLNPNKTSSKIKNLAKKINPSDAEHFASTSHKGLPDKKRVEEMISILKESTEANNVISKKFEVNGEFEKYAQKFTGLEFTGKELEAIKNFEIKPSENTKFLIRYESSDTFGNNTTTIIKKLRTLGKLCFTAFQKNSNSDKTLKPDEENPEEKLTVQISSLFSNQNDIESSDILNKFLESLNIT